MPAAWKQWLEEAAAARAMSMSDLIRQCIRELMTRLREAAPPAAS